jgi:hypothetical protein
VKGVLVMRFRTLTWLGPLCLALVLAAWMPVHALAAAQRGDEIDEDLEDAGVVSETAWESPQFGVEVSWDGDWEVMDTTYTAPEDFKDGLAIGTETVYFGVTVIESVDETPAEYMERLIELREEETEDLAIVDEGEDARNDLAYLVNSAVFEENRYFNVVEVTYLDEDDGLLLLVEMSMWEDEVEDAFDDAQDDVIVDGRAPFLHYDADLVLDLIDNANAPD